MMMMINPNQNPNNNTTSPLYSSSPIQVSDNNNTDGGSGGGYLMDRGGGSSSASGSFQNNSDGGFLVESVSDADFGFMRSELVRQSLPLVGTVEIYHRHVFLCYKNPKVWPPHVEAAEFDRLPRLLSAALLARKPEIIKQVRNLEFFIFWNFSFMRLTHFDIDTFVEEVLVKNSEWHPGTPETLTGSYVFVCSHGSRDRRCGVCGPALVSRFREEIDVRGLQGQVSVSPCSHIGGHKYAGNVIIFSRNADKQVTGHWYGYVTPEDVPVLLEQHIGKGEIIDRLWRGQMGLSEEDQKTAQELRLQLITDNGGTGSQENVPSVLSSQPSSEMNVKQVDAKGCCQGNGNGKFTCCQSLVAMEKAEETKHIVINNKKEAKSKTRGKQSVGAGVCSKKVCAMPTWFESWEREDTYAAVAVIGAIASVAIAYNSYKRL
ncbi:hypothetical protein ACHQM5_025477 [Ranunculus cassubicifolius]